MDGINPDWETLFEEHLGWAESIARKRHVKYARHTSWDILEDLDQAARIGLLEACEKFDPVKSPHFRIWAYHVITHRMTDHWRTDIDHLSRRMRQWAKDNPEAQVTLRPLSDQEERAHRSDGSDDVAGDMSPWFTFHEPGYDEVDNAGVLEHFLMWIRMESWFLRDPERHTTLIDLWLAGYNQREIGDILGVSESVMSHIVARLMRAAASFGKQMWGEEIRHGGRSRGSSLRPATLRLSQAGAAVLTASETEGH